MISIKNNYSTIVLFAFFSLFTTIAKSELIKNKEKITIIDSINSLIEISENYRFNTPEKGLKSAKRALKLSLAIQDTSLMIKSANKLAILEKENSINTTALGTIIQSLTWANKIENDSLIANSQLVAGHIYSNLNNKKQAIENYKKCLNFYKRVKDSSGISYTFSGLGIVYYDNHQYDKALNSYLSAERYWIDTESALKADLWNNIGALYVDKKEYKNANYYYNKALMHYSTKKWTNEISMVYDNLGELALLQNKIDDAKAFYNKSLLIGKKINSPTEIMWAYQGLFLTAKKAKKFKDALSFHEFYVNLKDSLNKAQSKKDVMEAEALYHQAEHKKKIKEQQIEIIKTEKKVSQEKLKNIIYITFSVAIFFILVLGSGFYLKLRNNNKILIAQKDTITNNLKEKELLLKEIHHRVKNNLQIISSLLNLQKHNINNKEVERIISETQNRITAISLVHQKLYQSENIGKIDFCVYLQELVDQQKIIFSTIEKPVRSVIEAPKHVDLSLDIAVPLGLIVSELITNAFKHAFNNNKNPLLILKLKELTQNNYELMIKDNGKGLSKEFEKEKNESLGMELVKILTKQIDGEIHYKDEKGAVFYISFAV